MKRLLTVLVLSLGSVAFAQQTELPRLPSDTELLATYCAALVRQRHDNVAASGHPAMQELATSLGKKHQRLVDFMAPRLKYLDSSALASAARRGAADQKEFEQMTSGCFVRCVPAGTTDLGQGRQECVDRCIADSDEAKRVRRCDDLSWLPL